MKCGMGSGEKRHPRASPCLTVPLATLLSDASQSGATKRRATLSAASTFCSPTRGLLGWILPCSTSSNSKTFLHLQQLTTLRERDKRKDQLLELQRSKEERLEREGAASRQAIQQANSAYAQVQAHSQQLQQRLARAEAELSLHLQAK